MGRKILSFSYYIETPSQVTTTPVPQQITNNFDYIGDVLSLDRLDNETNPEFRNRIWDTTVHPSNPTYTGVVTGIARDLGILREHTINIDLKLNSAGEVIAPNPRVDILANRIVLYSDWRPGGTTEVIDDTIYFYQPEDEGYFLSDLVAAINESSYFSANIYSGIRPNMLSTNLLRTNSDFVIRDDSIRVDKITYLTGDIVIQDSISFSEKKIFDTEVTGTPTASGQYSVDYKNGKVQVYDIPSGNGDCSYHTALFPMVIDSLPIEIYTLNDDDFQSELFKQKTLDSGETENGLPNEEGSEIFHQLFEETEVFWGE